MAVLIGVLAITGAIALGVYGLVAGSAGRMAVARTVATVQRGYVVGSLPDRESSFGQRVALPFAHRLGSLGRVFTPEGTRARLQRWLDRAGNPLGWTVDTLVMTKGVAMGYMAVFWGLIGLIGKGVVGMLIAAAIAGVIAFFLPDVLLLNAAQRRQEKLRRSLADVLDMLTVSVEAGLGFDAALSQVARNSRGPLAGEIARVLQEMQLGKTRVDALRDMASRTTVNELRTFASAVIQASELGIPIATVLREQAKEMRVRRRQRAEEKAQKVPIKILFPLIFLIFPALFIIILGPAVLRVIAIMLEL